MALLDSGCTPTVLRLRPSHRRIKTRELQVLGDPGSSDSRPSNQGVKTTEVPVSGDLESSDTCKRPHKMWSFDMGLCFGVRMFFTMGGLLETCNLRSLPSPKLHGSS